MQNNFESHMWTSSITGAGTVTFESNPDNASSSGDVVVIENTVLGDEIYLEYATDISAGEIIEFEFHGHNFAGSQSEALFRFESPLDINGGTIRANEDMLRSDDMSNYRLRYQAPFNEGFKRYPVTIQLGYSNTRIGKAKFYRPRIKKHSGTMGNRQILMDGVIRIASGGVAGAHEIATGYQTSNVDLNNITWNNTTFELQVAPVNRGSTTIQPLAHLTQVRVSGSDPHYLWKYRIVNEGTIAISAKETATGSLVNLNTIGTEVAVAFEVKA